MALDIVKRISIDGSGNIVLGDSTVTKCKTRPQVFEFIRVPGMGARIVQVADSAANEDGVNLTVSAGAGDGAGKKAGSLKLGGGGGANSAKQGNVALHSLPADWQAMERGCFLAGVTTAPTGNPAAGAFVWAASNGAALALRTTGGLAAYIGDAGLGFFASGFASPQAQVAAYTISWAGTASRTLANTTISGFTGQDNTAVGATFAKVADLNSLVTQVTSHANVLKQLLADLKGYGLTL